MLSYLKGEIMYKTPSSVMVRVGHMAYEVQVPSNRLLALGQEAEFYTYLALRDELFQLYGLGSWEEREFFLLLLNVSGIGPKAALTILGQSTPQGLQQAISEENIAFLMKVPGIGKKTAQRLILELKDKLPANTWSAIEGANDVAAAPLDNSGTKRDIYEALLGLGYHENEIRRIYPQIEPLIAQNDEQAAIKQALKLLTKF